jgi:hypothetical protein
VAVGTVQLDVRATFETHDGALIFAHRRVGTGWEQERERRPELWGLRRGQNRAPKLGFLDQHEVLRDPSRLLLILRTGFESRAAHWAEIPHPDSDLENASRPAEVPWSTVRSPRRPQKSLT